MIRLDWIGLMFVSANGFLMNFVISKSVLERCQKSGAG